ncbi:hypothetical protein SEVIR_5G343100v4 [Setaria viridis]|uniref:RCC1-like domain-containing protein n=3 Tax=Setaria TaxID=4554 RepID=K3XII1_SETIT|nr:ultraviolet-B receptor UVR8 [Setaria italica]XP_034593105.1 ultraviolet-B receptor UVR8 [Setaria viridis]RCV27620.1 hypothetical protein SETIT_5G338900v2 [Setaria italica]TKW17096.1 hypothetical protein SEVIR_5G343100v2 [Setaria viridis]
MEAAAALGAAAAPEEGRGEEEAAEWAWSWGAGTDGQLGNGGFDDHHLPQPLLLPIRCRGRVSLVAGGGAHAIALTSAGEVFTWGRGTHGQLGHGNLDNVPHPKFVKFLENHIVTCVSAGWNHSGFATDSGQLFMCGDGSFGQLGTGDNHSRSLPFEVAYFTSRHVEKLALGMRHSLVLLKDNSVCGFGSARRGQVGKCTSRNEKSHNVPRIIDGFGDVKIVNIYANGDHSAALDEYGHLYIWGRALIGQHDNDQPWSVFPSLSISQVALGWHHALLLSGGELFTIGVYRHQKCDHPVPGNVVGQQSKTSATSSSHDGSSSVSTLEKVPCIDGEEVVQIASGTEHSALVTGSGSVFTWGWGEHGQLGLGDTSDQVVPQRVNLTVSPGSRGIYCGSGFTIAVDLA